MQAQGVQQSLLHQQSKRCPPTERTERTESSCREEPPTDGTDQHRSFVGGYGILPYPRTHILEIASHRCKLRGGVQQSLLHQQSKRYPPTERTERTESSCREEPPTDGTDQHRSLGGAAPVLWDNTTHPNHLCKSVKSVGGHEILGRCTSCSGKRQSRAETSASPGRNPWESTSQQVTTDRKADRYPSFSEYLSAFFLLIM